LLGLAVAYAMMMALKAAIPEYSLPREAHITLDHRVLLFTLTVSVLTGMLFGLAPALHAGGQDLAAAMKEGGRGASAGAARQRLRSTLVVAELALAFVLLTGAGLLIRSFFQMQQVDAGFDATNVLTAGLPIDEERFPTADHLNSYLREIAASVQSIPGVRNVALTSALPMRGWGCGMPFKLRTGH
jgi:putative ABC transport system permease protein